MTKSGEIESIPSSDIKVGDFIKVEKDQRVTQFPTKISKSLKPNDKTKKKQVPADMVFLKTNDKTGASFIRTDQLDGETDWKLRRAVVATQKLSSEEQICSLDAYIYAEPPKKDIYSFVGNFCSGEKAEDVEPLTLENTLWSNTVLASGTVIGLVIYTGKETKSVLNTSAPGTKIGLLDKEINDFAKVFLLF